MIFVHVIESKTRTSKTSGTWNTEKAPGSRLLLAVIFAINEKVHILWQVDCKAPVSDVISWMHHNFTLFVIRIISYWLTEPNGDMNRAVIDISLAVVIENMAN